MLPSLDQRLHECLSQLLEEHPALVPLARHPVRLDLSPYDKGIVGGHVEDVVEDDQGPAGSHPSAAVQGQAKVQGGRHAQGQVKQRSVI